MPKRDRAVGGAGIFIILGFILVALEIGLLIYAAIEPGVVYETAVHSHMENAYWAADPTTMKSQLVEARDGMVALGLTENMYGAFFPWNKVPKNSMKWQYQHMDSLLIRTDEFIAWEKSLATTSTSQVKDVYTEKLDNMRGFLQEGGWSDDIAKQAFWVNNYLWLLALEALVALLIIIFFVIAAILFVVS